MIATPAAAPPAALSQPAPASKSQGALSAPQWVVKPSVADVLGVYPAEAKAQGVGGTGELACLVGADQTLTDCYLIRDEPRGGGFDKAALALTPMMRIRPPTRAGVPVPTRIDFPLRFDPPAPAVGEIPVSPRVAWSQAPTAVEVAAVYPKAAREKGAAGLGVMRCTVRSGALTACVAATQDADGFSRAATRLASKFAVGPTFGGARSTEGLIFNVPVAFGPPPAAAVVLANPLWSERPTPAQIAASYPAQARASDIRQVAVTLRCRIATGGGLEACAVKSEAPVGVGGAQAAARLSPAYRVSVWDPQGRSSAGALVDVAIDLTADDPQQAQPRH